MSLVGLKKNFCLDFAVGAPYDGPEGRGAVYIYHGVKGGVRENYAQVFAHFLIFSFFLSPVLKFFIRFNFRSYELRNYPSQRPHSDSQSPVAWTWTIINTRI